MKICWTWKKKKKIPGSETEFIYLIYTQLAYCCQFELIFCRLHIQSFQMWHQLVNMKEDFTEISCILFTFKKLNMTWPKCTKSSLFRKNIFSAKLSIWLQNTKEQTHLWYRNGTRFGFKRLEVNNNGFCEMILPWKYFKEPYTPDNYKVPKRETKIGLIYFSKRTKIFLNVFDKHVKNTNTKDTALPGKK